MSLEGKRGELLEQAAEKDRFRMQGLVMDVYDSRGAAKECLEFFRGNGWIRVVTHGVFTVTDEGRQALQDQEGNDDKVEGLDSFT